MMIIKIIKMTNYNESFSEKLLMNLNIAISVLAQCKTGKDKQYYYCARVQSVFLIFFRSYYTH